MQWRSVANDVIFSALSMQIAWHLSRHGLAIIALHLESNITGKED
jgi:hypothetical protein